MAAANDQAAAITPAVVANFYCYAAAVVVAATFLLRVQHLF